MKPPRATANLLLASFHSGSHLCLSGMAISGACWLHYSLPLTFTITVEKTKQNKQNETMSNMFCCCLCCLTLEIQVINITWTLHTVQHQSCKPSLLTVDTSPCSKTRMCWENTSQTLHQLQNKNTTFIQMRLTQTPLMFQPQKVTGWPQRTIYPLLWAAKPTVC